MRALLAEISTGATSDPSLGVPGRDLVPALLLLLIAAVVVLGAVSLVLTLHLVRQRRREREGDSRVDPIPPAPTALRSSATLLVPARWMAVSATTVREVRHALDLSNPTPCTIQDGLAGNHQQALFLAPPVDGWVLITGPGIPDPAEDIDEVYHLVRALSIKLGAAQFFCFNRVLGHHGWAWARGGTIVRAFAWAGTTLWNEGEPTPAERTLRLRSPRYSDPTPTTALARESILSNLDKVPILAGRWSVDPVSVHQQVPNGVGVAGEFTRIRSS